MEEKKISYSTLYVGEELNGISLYIIDHYNSFEEWLGIYKDNKDKLIGEIQDWFFLDLSDMVDEEEMSLETLEKVVDKFIEENIDELLKVIETLYKLNKKEYVG